MSDRRILFAGSSTPRFRIPPRAHQHGPVLRCLEYATAWSQAADEDCYGWVIQRRDATTLDTDNTNRGFAAGGFNWDLSASLGMHRTDHFVHNTINASLGLMSPTAFDVGRNRQRDVNVNFDGLWAVTDRVNIAAGAVMARRAVRPACGRPRGMDDRPVRGAGFHGRLQCRLLVQPAAGGHLEPPQRRGLRRPGGDRSRRRVDAGCGGPHRGLRGLRNDDQRQGVGPRRFRARQRQHRFPGADPRPAARPPHPELVRPDGGRSGQQRRLPSISPVALLRGGAPLGPEKSRL